jgi:hypothetical protein
MVRCSATGAACLFIHRTVIEAMAAQAEESSSMSRKVFPFFMESTLADLPAGEDLVFCLRAGVLGFPIYVHTGIEFGHHKSQLLTAAGFREQQRLYDDPEGVE